MLLEAMAPIELPLKFVTDVDIHKISLTPDYKYNGIIVV